MTTTRREFMMSAAAVGAAMAMSGGVRAAPAAVGGRARGRGAPKKILILGGTSFIGPALVEAAKARGHSLTLFNRGQTEKKKGFIDGVEHIYGNRDPELNADEKDPSSPKGLEGLKGKTWDVVVDTSGQYRRIVKASAELLAPAVQQYIYISSVSAYKESPAVGLDETAELNTLDDPSIEQMGPKPGTYDYYGGHKATCEKTAEAAMPGRVAIVRPGLIVGPGDGTDRFTYWPVRVSRGGEVLSPGTPEDPLQIIDVRDLADFLVVLIETGTMGAFDAIGPQSGLTIGRLVRACKDASKSDATFTWVDAAFLKEKEVSPWGDMPVWVPPEGDSAGFHQRNVSKAVKAGMKFRPVEKTVADTLAWWPKEVERRVRVTREMQAQAEKDAQSAGKEPPKFPDPTKLRAGISPEREAEVLKAWHEKQGK